MLSGILFPISCFLFSIFFLPLILSYQVTVKGPLIIPKEAQESLQILSTLRDQSGCTTNFEALLNVESDLPSQYRKALAFQVVNCYFHMFRKNWAVYCPFFDEKQNNNDSSMSNVDECVASFPDVAQPEFFKYYIHVERIYWFIRRLRYQRELQYYLRKGFELGMYLNQRHKEISENVNKIYDRLVAVTKDYTHLQKTVFKLLKELEQLQSLVKMFNNTHSVLRSIISSCERQKHHFYNLFLLVESTATYFVWFIFCRIVFCCLPLNLHSLISKGLLFLFLIEGVVVQMFFKEWRWSFRFITLPLLIPLTIAWYIYSSYCLRTVSKPAHNKERLRSFARTKIRMIQDRMRMSWKRKMHSASLYLSGRKSTLRDFHA